MTTLTLTADREGERADALLSRLVPNLTRSSAQKLLEQGLVTLEGTPARKNARPTPGQTLTVSLPDPEPIDILPQNIPLDVIYEDGDVIVVNKPVGLVVHPAPGHPDGTLVNALLYHCKNSLSGINGALRPGIVHRIDRDTSGLIIAAKNDSSHLSLAAQLQDHSLSRTYEAVAVGGLKEDSGTIDAPIGRHPADRKRMAVDRKNGRPAVTHWSVLARYPGYTHVECRLETGRTHQIRVHMSSIGHPLLGDTVYGAKKPVPGLAGQCLHARRLRFVHPSTGETVELECPLPPWFRAILDRLNAARPGRPLYKPHRSAPDWGAPVWFQVCGAISCRRTRESLPEKRSRPSWKQITRHPWERIAISSHKVQATQVRTGFGGKAASKV